MADPTAVKLSKLNFQPPRVRLLFPLSMSFVGTLCATPCMNQGPLPLGVETDGTSVAEAPRHHRFAEISWDISSYGFV